MGTKVDVGDTIRPRDSVSIDFQAGPRQSKMVSEDSECNKQELHRTVLNRCLPQLVLDLDFKLVSLYIQQKQLFHDVTLRDISDRKNRTEKIKALIQHVMQRGPKAYEMFKECLVEAGQTNLLEQLEHQEAEFQSGAAMETAAGSVTKTFH